MAYETSNPPALIAQGIGGAGPKVYAYNDDDAAADVDADGYITNGSALGLAVGDLVFHEDLSAGLTNSYRVEAVTAGSSANLGDASVIGSTTDSD
jgi:hypothetical protein